VNVYFAVFVCIFAGLESGWYGLVWRTGSLLVAYKAFYHIFCEIDTK